MEQAVATTAARDVDIVPGKDLDDFVTFFINDQMFGVPVLKVQDILKPDRIAPIPLAPPEVRGSINLRGRIVTVVDVRVRLGLEKRLPGETAAAAKGTGRPAADGSGSADGNAHPAQEEGPDEVGRPADDENRPAEGASPLVDEDTAGAGVHGICVTVEHGNEFYTLLVDRVGDVVSLSDDFFEDNPSTLDAAWREFALGVYRLESALMVVLDVGRLLDITSARD